LTSCRASAAAAGEGLAIESGSNQPNDTTPATMQFRTSRLRRRRRFGFCPFRCCCRGFGTHNSEAIKQADFHPRHTECASEAGLRCCTSISTPLRALLAAAAFLKLRPRPRLSVLHTIADGLADWSAGGGVSRRESKASIALYFRAVVVVDDGVGVAAVEARNGDVKR